MGAPNINNPYLPGVIFIPSSMLITAITKAYPAQITFTVPSTGFNTYRQGQLIRLFIPKTYGMMQANGKTVEILSVIDNTMLVDMDSSQFDAFAIPFVTNESPASFSPAGSRNLEFNNNTNQVAFQPLNNIGN